ncbi:MAG: TIGR01777 family oxidoreductase [Bryobacteraceae bacterium]
MRERPLRIVIPGGSGQLGQMLARHFREQDHSVTVLSRHPAAAEWNVVLWDGRTQGAWTSVLEGADAVINLAGRSVHCRYNAHNRRELLDSRVDSTRAVGEAIAAACSPPAVWLNASTAIIYRQSFDRELDESGELGKADPSAPEKWRFSIEVATAWEQALNQAQLPQTRKIALRTATVMSPNSGGDFDTFLRLVRCGLGAVGSGEQFISWIHQIDFIRAIEFLIQREDLAGPVNLSSPKPVTDRELMHWLRETWCPSYIGLSAPRSMVELGALVMRTETELMLKSRRVVPGRLTAAGFEFHFPEWRGACPDLIERWRMLQE